MAIQHRRGDNKDYDPSKMRSAEIGVALDEKRAYMAFAPGDSKEFAWIEDVQGMMIKQTFSHSGMVSIPGTAPLPLVKNEVRGAECVQNGTNGYQLVPTLKDNREGINTIIETFEASQEIKINGTSAATYTRHLYKDGTFGPSSIGNKDYNFNLEVGATYTLTMQVLSGSYGNTSSAIVRMVDGQAIDAYSGVSIDNPSVTFIPTQPDYYLYLRAAQDVPFDNLVIKVMLEKGTTAHSWEPYTGGIASPNPSYPVPIEKTEMVEVKVCGKNICQRTTSSNLYNKDHLIPVKTGDKVYVYMEFTGTTSNTMYARIFNAEDVSDKSASGSNLANFNSGSVVEYSITKDGFFGICYNAGVSTYTVSKAMISFVPFTEDEYEEYTEQTTTIPITLYGIGDVRDSVDLATGVVTRRVCVIDLGTLNWAYGADYHRFGSSAVPIVKQKARTLKMFCDIYPCIYDGRAIGESPDKIFHNGFVDGNAYLYINESAYTSASKFKESVSGHFVVAPLEIPYTEQITPVPVRTLYGATTFSFEDQTGTALDGELTACMDTKAYIDKLLGVSALSMDEPRVAAFALEEPIVPEELGELNGITEDTSPIV